MKLCEDVELLCLAVRFFKHIALQLGKHAAILPIFHTGRGVQTNVFFCQRHKQARNSSFTG